MILIIEGRSGSGKTTAIRRILKYCGRPVYGFWTEKLPSDPGLPAPVYLHSFREPLAYSGANKIGVCTSGSAAAFPEAFDAFGCAVLNAIPPGSFVVLDEIGVMEHDALSFREAVLRAMEQNDVLLAVRDKDDDFLNRIRTFPGAMTVPAAEANTDAFAGRAAALFFA